MLVVASIATSQMLTTRTTQTTTAINNWTEINYDYSAETNEMNLIAGFKA